MYNMYKQKRIAFVVLFAIIISIFSFINVSALKIGDEIGNVLNTDIKTYINGQRIPSYNINNKSAVLIKDLINYGFDSSYNDQTRTSRVTYNPNKKVTPLTNFDETKGIVGTVAFRYVYTDIVAFVNGKQVESFNIKGNLAIFFGDLGDYGKFAWNNATRESRFTSTKLVTGITLNRTTATMKTSESLTLKATLSPSDATDKTLKWTSSNTAVAQVTGNNDEAYITGVSAGTAIITATSASGVTEKCTITVQPAGIAVTKVTLSKSTATVRVNEWTQITATIAPTNATDKTLKWESSDTNIARAHDGDIIGVTPGTVTITVTAPSGASAKCTVTVLSANVEVTGVTLDKKTESVSIGSTITLTATVSPSNATDKTVSWSSSHPNIASVNNYGQVTGISSGTATISATSNGKTATCVVTVKSSASDITGIKLSKTTETVVVGGTFILTPTVTPSTASTENLTWTSTRPDVAYYHNGVVYTFNPGTTTITASANGKSATCTVTVYASGEAITQITLNSTTKTMIVGEWFALTATVTPSTASTASLTWTSSRPDVAYYSNGIVYALTPGTTTITASANGKSAMCTVTVYASGEAITQITLNTTVQTIIVKQSFQLTATVTPATASTANLIWTSSNPAVASVSSNGNTCYVTGNLAGQARITVTTSDGKFFAICDVYVT